MPSIPLDQRIGWSAIVALILAAGSWVWHLAITQTEVRELTRRVELADTRLSKIDDNGTRGQVRIEAKLEAIFDRLERIENQLVSKRTNLETPSTPRAQ